MNIGYCYMLIVYNNNELLAYNIYDPIYPSSAFDDAISAAKKIDCIYNSSPPAVIDKDGTAMWKFLDNGRQFVYLIYKRIFSRRTVINTVPTGPCGPIGVTGSTGAYNPAVTSGMLQTTFALAGDTGCAAHYPQMDGKPKGYVVMECDKDGNMKAVVVKRDVAAHTPVVVADGYVAPTSIVTPPFSGATGPCGYTCDRTPDPIVKDDPFANSLPVGWNLGNKPITIQDLKNYPDDIKDFSDCSENQLFGLIIARINKRPNYVCHLDNAFFTYSKDRVLTELKTQSQLGWQIRDFELEALENFVNNYPNNT
jgi:hypothetical protein